MNTFKLRKMSKESYPLKSMKIPKSAEKNQSEFHDQAKVLNQLSVCI